MLSLFAYVLLTLVYLLTSLSIMRGMEFGFWDSAVLVR